MQGKVIAITGGASGIGLALAKLLSSRGALLSLADLQINALTRAADSIRELGGKVITNVVDVRNPAEVDAFLDATVNEYGRLDGAANLAGVIGRTMYKVTTADLSNEDWEFVMGINATGVFNCVRKELQIIVDGGSIVNAASVLGLRGTEKNPAYSASKHAVVGLTKSAAADSGHRNIRVNAVAPGTTDTPMVAEIERSTNRATHNDKLAIKRKGKPEEVAYLIAFLLSDESQYVTGSIYSIDGGWNI